MSRRERWGWCAVVLLLVAAVRLPLHYATFGLPVSNDDAIPLMIAERILHGELSTILWNQPYNGTLDAYLMAPGLLIASPQAAFRGYEMMCGLALITVASRLACAVAGERAGWIAATLAAAGTPYMGLMAALGPTPNFLVPLLVGFVTLMGLRGVSKPWTLAGLGVVCGLAVWNSFLALPALVGAALGLAAAGLRPRWRTAVWIAAGAAIGMTPLLLARATGAAGATPVTALRPRWLWTTGVQDLGRAARGLFGLDVPLVIDGPERAGLPLGVALVLATALLLLVAMGSARVRSRALVGWAIALAAAFALSRRTGGDEVRYLFGLTVPVIALCGAGASALHDRLARRAWLGTTIVLAAVLVPWLVGHRRLLAAWHDPAHATEAWQVPPLDAAVAALRETGTRSAYASLQFAGRLTVEGRHALIASQAWNERIPGDPLRYRDEVDLDPRPAWVLSPRWSRGMPRAAGFRQMLAEMGGTWREEKAGALALFHDFRPPYDEGRPVPAREIALRTMDGIELPASVLDRDRRTQWTSPAAVARGSGLVLSFMARRRVSAVVFLAPLDPVPGAIPWVAEADGVVIARGPVRYALQWVNGAPRAGRQALMVVPLRDRSLHEVRIIFQESGPPLTITEAFVYGPDEVARPAAGGGWAGQAYESARGGDWREAERLYVDASRQEPDRASHHAAALRAGWRALRRTWLDVESLDDGGPALFEPGSGGRR